MKRLFILASLIVMPFFCVLYAQTTIGPNDILSKDNASISGLKGIFENAFYEIKESSDTYFSFKDTYTIYLDLDKDNRYITLSVNWPLVDNATTQDKFSLLNRIGKEVLLVTPYYTDAGTSLINKTTIWIEGGMNVKNLILTEKLFVKALNLIVDKDDQKILK